MHQYMIEYVCIQNIKTSLNQLKIKRYKDLSNNLMKENKDEE